MTVFISGPISGKPNCNREAFLKAQEELEKHGYSVYNPIFLPYPRDVEFSRINISALKHCTAIYMLKGWMQSESACNEHEIAVASGLIIMYEGTCCWGTESDDEHAEAWEKWKSKLPDNFCNKKDIIENINIKATIRAMNERIDIISKKLDDYKEAYMHLSNADEALERRIKFLEKKYKELSETICNQGKDIEDIVQNAAMTVRLTNNSLNDLNIRLKAIEKKCGYSVWNPAELEKD